MIGSRTVTALVFLVSSLAASAVLWWYFGTMLFFLFVPFVPFLFRGLGSAEEQTPLGNCPQCGFQTTTPEYEYCPRDGRRLEWQERANDGSQYDGRGRERDNW